MAAEPGAFTPLTLPVLPLDDEVVLPGMVVPLELSDSEVRAAVEAAQAAAKDEPGKPKVLLVPRIEGTYAKIGVLGTVEQVGRLAGGDPGALIRGRARVRIGAGTTGPGAALWVEGTRIDESVPDPLPGQVMELVKEYKALATAWLRKRGAWQVVDRVQAIDDVAALADNSGYSPFLTTDQKVTLLETTDPVARLRIATQQLRDHLAEQDVAEAIAKDVQEGVDKQQREFLLRRQLEAVRKELRELSGDKGGQESDDYRARVEAADLPEKVREAALKEVDKLERASDASPEGSWIRTWLDTVLDMPWNKRTEDAYDIRGAKEVLDAEHSGLEDVKERIIEYLAVRKRRRDRGLDVLDGGPGRPEQSDRPSDRSEQSDQQPGRSEQSDQPSDRSEQTGQQPGRPSDRSEEEAERNAPAARRSARRGGGAVLALVGPPGVGKTSLGESVAHAMGRSFVRVALGGVRDEAEIRGHRRTYVGALPGRIVRAIKEAGSMNPVVLLDEIDKVGSDFRGDPAAALLEVLDPAQNHTFRDHYLEVELDLSDVVFLATANVLEAIPGPLADRMEIVRLDGYTEDEKIVIARDHLIPRQLERAGLRADEVTIEESAVRKLAGEYTREAGVRDLERSIARLLRKVAAQHELGERELPFTVREEDLRGLLGRPRHVPESAQDPAERRTSVPGVATGLAVTGAGGDVLFVEASLADPETGAAGLTLTGHLGDVMKESAQIALSFLRSHGAELELPVGDLKDRGVHIHFPAGAVPKDGPSAGITMTTALASLLSGRLVRPDVAMTGEVSLTGRVLPIGGVKQKLLAAHRAGVTTVIIPKRNEADLDDVPAEVLDKLDVRTVTDVRQVLELALEPATKGAEPEVPVAV
ncbi:MULTISPECIES: endopeptidase La [Streptomyces]|uniref:Lon protease n=1 Tax=Streptomyces thermogriseus TaxID=75292 RepID=A0ABN1SRT9_9ACTN|nr:MULTISPECIES: endopeptidase La [Streptomyces]MDN5382420.1 endopeptidase La [Streptomyces sp. LB8]